MIMRSTAGRGRRNTRGIVAVFGCIFGLGLIVVGFSAGTMKSPKKEAAAEDTPAAQAAHKKPARAWNMALGNVVVVAEELGFEVNTATENAGARRKVISRLESQLQRIRELYRQESDQDPALMGGMVVQFNVNPSGEVSQVKEVASRMLNADFKKVVIGEISKWSFQDVISDNASVKCPLLFVREGMDITTLVQWEKALGQVENQSALTKNNARAAQPSTRAALPRDVRTTVKAAADRTAPRAASLYEIKYATSSRREPNFTSTTVTKFPIGAKVILLGSRGDWLEVRRQDGGPSGFIRKEFVTSVDLARKQ